MPWVGFATRAAFDAVHDQVCTELGIPRPGKRQSDQAVQINNQWTHAQWAPLVIDVVVNGNPRKIGIASVSQATADRFGLSVVTIVSNNQDGTWNVIYNGNPFTVQPVLNEGLFPFRKPKPPTWTDPDTGITYDTTTGLPIGQAGPAGTSTGR